MTDTEAIHTTLISYSLPGGTIDAESITYPLTGRTSYHVGFTTLDDGVAVRASVVSQHDDALAALRAASRLMDHFEHVLAAKGQTAHVEST